MDDRLNIIVFLEIRTYHEIPPTFDLLCTVIENLIHLAIATVCILFLTYIMLNKFTLKKRENLPLYSIEISWIEYRNSVINCMNSVQSQLIRTGGYRCEFSLQLHLSNSFVEGIRRQEIIIIWRDIWKFNLMKKSI